MQIACPSCAAVYNVPDARLKPGKSVRCARCGTNWLPHPEDEQAPPQEPSEHASASDDDGSEATVPPPATRAAERLLPPQVSRPRQPALIGAWVATGLVLVGAVAAIIGWRDTIVRVWPPGGRILPVTVHTERHAAETEGKKAE